MRSNWVRTLNASILLILLSTTCTVGQSLPDFPHQVPGQPPAVQPLPDFLHQVPGQSLEGFPDGGPHEVAASDGTVCRRAYLQGFKGAQAIGEKWTGESTTHISSLRLYLSVEHGALWLQSNFLTGNSSYPTKIATRQNTDIRTLLYNIVGEEKFSGFSQSQVLNAVESVPIYAANTFFTSEYKNFDFGDAKNIYVIGPDGVSRPSVVMQSENDSPSLRIVEYAPNLYGVAGWDGGPKLFERLKNEHFQRASVKLLSVVMNRKTREALPQLIPPEHLVSVPDFSAASIEDAIKANAGSLLFILGHVDKRDNAVVTTDEKRRILARMPIEELQTYARDNKVRLFILGCNSALTINEGTADIFNSVDAVTRFSSALSAISWLEFYTRLADKKLRIVLGSTAEIPDGEGHVEMHVFELLESGRARIVGKLSHSFPAAPPPPPAPPDPDLDFGWLIEMILLALGGLFVSALVVRGIIYGLSGA